MNKQDLIDLILDSINADDISDLLYQQANVNIDPDEIRRIIDNDS